MMFVLGNIYSVICTGDNAFTGCAVGRKVGILTTTENDEKATILGSVDDNDSNNVVWSNIDTQSPIADVHDEKHKECKIVLTAGAFRLLRDEMCELLDRVVVYAR